MAADPSEVPAVSAQQPEVCIDISYPIRALALARERERDRYAGVPGRTREEFSVVVCYIVRARVSILRTEQFERCVIYAVCDGNLGVTDSRAAEPHRCQETQEREGGSPGRVIPVSFSFGMYICVETFFLSLSLFDT